jgi:hypothetical protein
MAWRHLLRATIALPYRFHQCHQRQALGSQGEAKAHDQVLL